MWPPYGPVTGQWSVGGHWSVVPVVGNAQYPPADDDDVLTVDQLKERARIVPGDFESDELMKSYIRAARLKVERDTGCALPEQYLAVSYDRIDSGVYLVPMPPLQEVMEILYFGTDGSSTSVDLDALAQVDLVSFPARLLFATNAFTGLPPALPMQPLGLIVKAGCTTDTLPDALRFAVGLLASHYLTTGRDMVVSGGDRMSEMPYGYEDAIAPHRLVSMV